MPGLSWSGEGRGCNNLLGSLIIDELVQQAGQVVRLTARFEQQCDNSPGNLRGYLRYDSADTTTPPPPGDAADFPWSPPAGAVPETGDYLYFESSPGDYIGQGQTRLYTAPNATITGSESSGVVRLRVTQVPWDVFVTGPDAQTQLLPGLYEDLGRYPFHNPTEGGLSMYGEGRGCNELDGRVRGRRDRLRRAGDRLVLDPLRPALRGHRSAAVRRHALDPPGRLTRLAGTTWRPPAATIGLPMTIAPNDFTHLHVHSEFSLLDGLGRITELVDAAAQAGMDSMAITDHGALYGAVAFYQAAKNQGIKPIIGVETYVAPRSMTSKEGKADAQPYHLILLAKDYRGYQNLCRLVTDAHVDGYYYKPRIDHDHLAKYSEGLIGLSACLGGEVAKALEVDDWEQARKVAGRYGDIFGKDGFFLELQDHGLRRAAPAQRAAAPAGARRSGCRWSSPTTCTTSARTSPRPTTSCSASGPATTSTRRTA